MSGQNIQIRASDGRSFGAYISRPAHLPAPGVVVLQEIFGVNAFLRDVVQQVSESGFIAIAPQLYWRQQADVELDSDDEADMKTALLLLEKLDERLAIADATAAISHLRGLPECTGRVGAMGYCLGGKLAYLMAARSNLDAAVAYYGTGIHTALDEAANLRAPVLLHIAGEDFLCPPAAQQRVQDRLSDLQGSLEQEATVHVYAGAGHGFTRKGKSPYNAQATERANARTREFFARHLRQPE